MTGERGQLFDACFIDGARFVARSDSALYTIDAASGSVLETVSVPQPLEQMTASRNGIVACVSTPGAFSIARGRLADLHDAIVDGRLFRHVALSADGTRAILAYGNAAAIVDVAGTSTVADLFGHSTNVNAVAISGDGTVAVTGAEEIAIVWDVASASPRHELGSHARSIRRVAIDDAARTIATIDSMLVVRTWDACSGRCLLVHAFDGRHALALAFDATGTRLMVLLSDGSLVQFGRNERDGLVWWQPMRSSAGIARDEMSATLSIDIDGSRAVVAGPLDSIPPDWWRGFGIPQIVELASGTSRNMHVDAENFAS